MTKLGSEGAPPAVSRASRDTIGSFLARAPKRAGASPASPVRHSLQRFIDFARNHNSVVMENDKPLPLWISRANVVSDIERRFCRSRACAFRAYEPACA